MGWEDSEINSPDADNKSDVIFKSSQIKEGDHSDFFVNVQGDEARKRAEKRQQEAHDGALEKHRKQFQNDLKIKRKQSFVPRNVPSEKKNCWPLVNG